jgi:hypothetical protein
LVQGLPFTRRRQFAVPSSTRMQAFLRRARHKAHHTLRAINQFMTVPMWSACISIVVAMIPPLQATLVKTKPLTQAITSAGQCSSEYRETGNGARLTPSSPAHIGRPRCILLQPANSTNRTSTNEHAPKAQILRWTWAQGTISKIKQARRNDRPCCRAF